MRAREPSSARTLFRVAQRRVRRRRPKCEAPCGRGRWRSAAAGRQSHATHAAHRLRQRLRHRLRGRLAQGVVDPAGHRHQARHIRRPRVCAEAVGRAGRLRRVLGAPGPASTRASGQVAPGRCSTGGDEICAARRRLAARQARLRGGRLQGSEDSAFGRLLFSRIWQAEQPVHGVRDLSREGVCEVSLFRVGTCWARRSLVPVRTGSMATRTLGGSFECAQRHKRKEREVALVVKTVVERTKLDSLGTLETVATKQAAPRATVPPRRSHASCLRWTKRLPCAVLCTRRSSSR